MASYIPRSLIQGPKKKEGKAKEEANYQGIDVKEMLAGAALIDEEIRIPVLRNNPAALLAYLAMRWYWIGSCRIEYCS
ncbi:glucose-6-phosphate isomerase 1, chloroplastic-like isoform X3 [Chenopodium quinoa]|uniref:glucose-6-phosphate isomerase 1, chloroplastic-like isoform X3 n=1 Tax=Chenopodium quinoa TaxID=63459 RepID=UPI000B776DC0|nr:glucose-6-phosphate isomerase 1, chloroplastic-like isoform X3 [Chenopodium quinoa]